MAEKYYGWFSVKAFNAPRYNDSQVGYLYRTPEGDKVLVTTVGKSMTFWDCAWDDIKFVGEVTNFISHAWPDVLS